MRVAIIGPRQAGKTTAARIVADLLNTQCANVSDYILEEIRDVVGADRANDRWTLFVWGRAKEHIDPLYFIRRMVKDGIDVIAGIRTVEEITAAREKGWPSMHRVIYVDRPGHPRQDDDQVGPEYADAVIHNNGSIDQLRERLANALGLGIHQGADE